MRVFRGFVGLHYCIHRDTLLYGAAWYGMGLSLGIVTDDQFVASVPPKF
jgi:hypothetical protein